MFCTHWDGLNKNGGCDECDEIVDDKNLKTILFLNS